MPSKDFPAHFHLRFCPSHDGFMGLERGLVVREHRFLALQQRRLFALRGIVGEQIIIYIDGLGGGDR